MFGQKVSLVKKIVKNIQSLRIECLLCGKYGAMRIFSKKHTIVNITVKNLRLLQLNSIRGIEYKFKKETCEIIRGRKSKSVTSGDLF
jgi:hypothetical protein